MTILPQSADHPAAVLRAPDGARQEELRLALVNDLRVAVQAMNSP
jgi:hypothetical protein